MIHFSWRPCPPCLCVFCTRRFRASCVRQLFGGGAGPFGREQWSELFTFCQTWFQHRLSSVRARWCGVLYGVLLCWWHCLLVLCRSSSVWLRWSALWKLHLESKMTESFFRCTSKGFARVAFNDPVNIVVNVTSGTRLKVKCISLC